MRRLFVPACGLTLLTLSLFAWSRSIGPELLPTELSDSTAGNAVASARAEDEAARAAAAVSNGDAEQYEFAGPVAELVPANLKPLTPIVKPIIPRSRAEICETLTNAAHNNDLPAPFFIRLLYQESAFRPGIVSAAGAEGVAQFMPETSADRGLDNPFDPVQAITASASLLRDLAHRFGNLGLAAAAYNAGPKRVTDWLAKKAKLPQETKDYVKTITGRPADSWTTAENGSPAIKLPRHAPCQQAAGLLAWDGPDRIPLPPTRLVAHPPAKGNVMLAMRAKAGLHKARKPDAKLAGEVKSPPKEPAKPRDSRAAGAKTKRELHLSER